LASMLAKFSAVIVLLPELKYRFFTVL